MDDHEVALLAALGAGTPDWAAIYEHCRAQMYRAAHGALRFGTALSASPDDVVSKAIIEAMDTTTSRPSTSLCGWLAAIVRNRARDLIRRARRGREAERAATEILAGSAGEADRDARLDEIAEEALLSLDARDQYVIHERVMKNRPAQEVADFLGVSPQRVAQLVNRAIKRLRASPEFTRHDPFDQV